MRRAKIEVIVAKVHAHDESDKKDLKIKGATGSLVLADAAYSTDLLEDENVVGIAIPGLFFSKNFDNCDF